jgi:phospholipid/cholesterol/gamma-HCH transport system ATP-binding protein
MRKRAALARALALEPDLLFLDEPTSGLDPVGAREFYRLLRALADSLGLTVLFLTHDLDMLVSIADRVIALSGGKLIADGTVATVRKVDHPWLQEYFASRA